jgi:hypothetical protein
MKSLVKVGMLAGALLMGIHTVAAPLVAAQGYKDKNVVVLPFESAVEVKPGFLDAARASVVAYLKDGKVFASVTAVDKAEAKANALEFAAKLLDFNAGSMATRVMVGLGTGRASAKFEFTLKESESGKIVWKKAIQEKANYWSNSASSAAQRQELPDKIAETLLKELKKL